MPKAHKEETTVSGLHEKPPFLFYAAQSAVAGPLPPPGANRRCGAQRKWSGARQFRVSLSAILLPPLAGKAQRRATQVGASRFAAENMPAAGNELPKRSKATRANLSSVLWPPLAGRRRREPIRRRKHCRRERIPGAARNASRFAAESMPAAGNESPKRSKAARAVETGLQCEVCVKSVRARYRSVRICVPCTRFKYLF